MQEMDFPGDANGTSRTESATREWLPRLAHDLRSPLAPLRIAGQMLQLDDIPMRELQELGRAIGRQTRLLQQLADDLDDVLRINHHAFRLDLQPCDIGAVVASAVAAAPRRSLDLGRAVREVGVRPAPGPIVVNADPDRLKRVVTEMIGAVAPPANGDDACWIECTRTADAAIVRMHDDSTRIYRSAGIEYLAHGTFPEDSGMLAMSSVIAREIALAHSAVLDIGHAAEGPVAEMVLRMPLAGSVSH